MGSRLLRTGTNTSWYRSPTSRVNEIVRSRSHFTRLKLTESWLRRKGGGTECHKGSYKERQKNGKLGHGCIILIAMAAALIDGAWAADESVLLSRIKPQIKRPLFCCLLRTWSGGERLRWLMASPSWEPSPRTSNSSQNLECRNVECCVFKIFMSKVQRKHPRGRYFKFQLVKQICLSFPQQILPSPPPCTSIFS